MRHRGSGALFAFLLAACSSFEPASVSATDAGASSEDANGPVDAGGCFQCPTGAICEDFERKDLSKNADWTVVGSDNIETKVNEAPPTVGCGLRLWVDIGEPKIVAFRRALTRLVLLDTDQGLTISFDGQLVKRGTYGATDFSAFVTLSGEQFSFTRPFLALVMDATGYSLLRYDGVSYARTPITLGETGHRLKFVVPRTGPVDVQVDGVSTLAPGAPSFSLGVGVHVGIGLASPKGSGGSNAWIDNVVIEKEMKLGRLVLALAVGCSSYSSDPERTDAAAPITDASSSSSSSGTDACVPSPLACPAFAFCDDFERDVPVGAGWGPLGNQDIVNFHTVPTSPCGRQLYARTGNGNGTRMITRVVTVTNNAVDFDLDLTVPDSIDTKTFGETDASAFLAIGATALTLDKPYAALGATKGGIAYFTSDGTTLTPHPFNVSPGVKTHLRWKIRFAPTSAALDVDGVPVIPATSAGLEVTATQLNVALGVASSAGVPPGATVLIDDFKATTP